MKLQKNGSTLIGSVTCSLALMVFSFFISFTFPLKLISIFSLLAAAWIISENIRVAAELRKITGVLPPPGKLILYIITGILGGMALAIFYRWYLDAPLLPESVSGFALVAALIGGMEELVFRGYLQESVKKYGSLFSITFGTISHTCYKCCLFLSPMAVQKVDIVFLALWTFIAGIIFGTIKHYSKSILPPLIGHALFDIIVYAGFVKAPWWVW